MSNGVTYKHLLLISGIILVLVICASEGLMLIQPSLTDRQTSALLPQRNDKTDMYFVGFGADSSQAVFQKETLYVRQMFDDIYDTKGRSAILINGTSTGTNTPMATLENLERTLKSIGSILDRENDLLFLFLTGHGSGNGLYVNAWPHHDEFISPAQLKTALAGSGIKWKIIVVSSCFSGVFTYGLVDLHTIVITASDADKASFGCSTTSEFTYFGEAFFRNHLSQKQPLYDAFYKAKEEIRLREEREGYAHSNPIFASSKPISDKALEVIQ